jgi:hypothetical protein
MIEATFYLIMRALLEIPWLGPAIMLFLIGKFFQFSISKSFRKIRTSTEDFNRVTTTSIVQVKRDHQQPQ